MQTTLQTRPFLDEHAQTVLDAWGELYGRAERTLFAQFCRKGQDTKAALALKSEFCRRFSITARQFNAMWTSLKGKISSREEVDKLARDEIQGQLKKVQAELKKLAKQEARHTAKERKKFDGKRRREARLKRRLAYYDKERVALCFGSRKLFRAQFSLKRKDFKTREARMDAHAQWKAQWREARSNAFFLVGSKDETSGNQTCVATFNRDTGRFSLRLRVPDALVALNKGAKFLVLGDIYFPYGQIELMEALDVLAEEPKIQAVSYRFKRDAKGWRVFASTDRVDERPELDRRAFQKLSRQKGVVGVDINYDHLAVAETDGHGNLVNVFRIACQTHCKTANARMNAVRIAGKTLAQYAAKAGKPLVHEVLDFKRKKREMKAVRSERYARMLSAFAYSGVLGALKSNAMLLKVPVGEVNPAYTSVIGQVKYARPKGLSVHLGAAYAIARRGMGFGERAARQAEVCTGKDHHLKVELPVRNRSMQAWGYWAAVRAKIKATLAGYYRARKKLLASLRPGKKTGALGVGGGGRVQFSPETGKPFAGEGTKTAFELSELEQV